MFNYIRKHSVKFFKAIIGGIIPLKKEETPQQRWKKLFQEAENLMTLGKLNEAGELVQKALDIADNNMGTGNWRFFDSIEYLTLIRCLQGRKDESHELCERFLKEKLNYYGPDNESVIQSFIEMGLLYYQNSDFEKAVKLHEKTIQLCENNYRPEHHAVISLKTRLGELLQKTEENQKALNIWRDLNRTAQNINNAELEISTSIHIAACRAVQGNIEEALTLVGPLLKRIEEPYDENDLKISFHIRLLARVLAENQKLTESEKLLLKSIEVITGFMGEDNALILTAMKELVFVHVQSENFREAEDILLKGYKIWNRFDEDDQERSEINWPSELAHFYDFRNRPEESERLLARELEKSREKYSEESIKLIESLHAMAMNYHEHNKFKDSEKLLREIHAILMDHSGRDHADTISCKLLIGLSLNHQRRFTEAKEVLLKAMKIFEKTGKSENLIISQVMENLAISYYELGGYRNAEMFYTGAAEILEEHLGPEHPSLVSTLLGLSNSKLYLNKYSEAQEIFERTLQIYSRKKVRNTLPKIWMARIIFYRSRCFLLQKRYGEAEAGYLRSLMMFEKEEGDESSFISSGLFDLGKLYLQTGRIDEAKANFERLLEITGENKGTGTLEYIEALKYIKLINDIKEFPYRDEPDKGKTLH